MNILMVCVDAKFIHSNLALRSLCAYCQDFGEHLKLKEFSINQSETYILGALYREKPDAVCFSVYIWNAEMIKRLVANIKKVMPQTTIVLGGPEISEKEWRKADVLVIGEGEMAFRKWLESFLAGGSFNISVQQTVLSGNPLPLVEIPFPYIEPLANRILYYETSKGCPFSCQYCLSSSGSLVRFLPFARVESDLQFFLQHKVPQVKLVDRTFNCKAEHAMAIWQYLIKHDNGVTNFHFEIAVDLLTEAMFKLLKTARNGLFQFEIGVQSTNLETLAAISRKTQLPLLFENVRKLQSLMNIHIHLDLIAGLPLEDYQSFANSFNDVYALAPQQLQMGFLKVLKGSELMQTASQWGIVFQDEPPYEVLFTNHLSYGDILQLKEIEKVLETYYNSGIFAKSVAFLASCFKSPFLFYEQLACFWRQKHYFDVLHSKRKHYEILFEFCQQSWNEHLEIFRNLLTYDLFRNENIKTPPLWALSPEKEKARMLYVHLNHEQNSGSSMCWDEKRSSAQFHKMCNLVCFSFHVETYEKVNQYILFDEQNKDNPKDVSEAMV